MSQFSDMSQPGTRHDPFAAGTPGFPPPKRSNLWLWILLGIGGVGALVCCGCGGLMWFGWSQATGVLETQLQAKLNEDDTAKQHLGTVHTTKLDLMASGEATQKAGGGKNMMRFHVEGDKGKGDVVAEQSPTQIFENAKLILPSNEEIDLGF
jgi:hypothetical protein